MTQHAQQDSGRRPTLPAHLGPPTPDPLDPDFLRHPAAQAEVYIAAGLWGDQRLDEVLLAAAAEADAADRPAITDASMSITHAQLPGLVSATAAQLRAHGIESGTRVVLHLPDSPNLIVTAIALLQIGAIPVFALPAHRVQEITHFATVARATVHLLGPLPGLSSAAAADLTAAVESVVPGLRTVAWGDDHLHPATAAGAAAVAVAAGLPTTASGTANTRPATSAADLAFFQLSGGTTGASKLIPRAHREYIYSFLRSNTVCGFDAATALLPAVPLAHNFPMSSPGWMGALAAGGHVVIPPAVDAHSVFAAVGAHRVTHIQAVPPLVHSWLDSGLRPPAGLQRILIGGARLAESTARRVSAELAPLQQVYGMAEGLVCYTPLDGSADLIATTQGRPMSPADEVRVVDADGCVVPTGETGELLVRGPYTIPGYYAAPQVNAASFTADGFFRTSDLVRCSPDGDISVVGRVKEQINRGGEKIAPAEVESLLMRHPGVSDARVRGAADPVLGERVEAHIVPRPGWEDALSSRVLRRHLRDISLADYKIPETFTLVTELPQTPVGKISRTAAAACAPDDATVVDVVGVGFGPANMALAAALSELPASEAPTAVFLDAAAGPQWHAGMLLPDASLQVSYIKDLVTLRNPCSQLSFLNFLVAHDRIQDFFNRGSSEPLRVEFAAYLQWAAEQLGEWVRYSHRVTSIEPIAAAGDTAAEAVAGDSAGAGGASAGSESIIGYIVRAETPDGPRTYVARDVVLACGLQPYTPAEFGIHERLIHSADYLHRIGTLPIDEQGSDAQPGDRQPGDVSEAGRAARTELVVIGGGQSGAEVCLDLRERFPAARVHLVHSRFGLIPSDATPYANRIFDHASVDRLYYAPTEVRDRLSAVHRNTNYSVVHENTIQALYDAQYADRWAGDERIVIHDASRIESITEATVASGTVTGALDAESVSQRDGQPPRLTVAIGHELDGSRTVITADAVVSATGYRPLDPAELLGPAGDELLRDDAGRVLATRDYRLQWDRPDTGRLFALGVTGHQHGIAATLLSDVALRAGEITAALLDTPAESAAERTVSAHLPAHHTALPDAAPVAAAHLTS
ncbi:SidA/IucD/PvdA family monooxygenase [Brevibacterium gallinarum]|uniref:L-lysine N6-monooxygenase MbtG n=1 Tax=Brevibacterium gallinarum TaxID=2762220 RepID=A0ABR8WSD2_9MICO|nr:SidA/IucD/PvdA family monooxygenase [Brevibacterium gallinarum]MBD8019905.1 SidA/IucD/PvdA family monooxygenase [Brevibacterium gallinarum]